MNIYMDTQRFASTQLAGSLLGPSTLSVFGIVKSPHTWMIKGKESCNRNDYAIVEKNYFRNLKF